MKAFSFLFKVPINIFAAIIKCNRNAIKYLFSHPLQKEVVHFLDSSFQETYPHIYKAILLEKGINKNKEGIIIDVGGGIGITAKFFLKAYPNNKVWIFEPLESNRIDIQKTLNRTKNYILIDKAVGSKVEKTIINIANRITSSSLLSFSDSEQYNFLPDALNKKGFKEIEVISLDMIIPLQEAIKILKIDVQGYELEVLKGAEETLKRTQIIVIEMNNHRKYKNAAQYYEVDALLRKSNFILCDIIPSLKEEGVLKEFDAIYSRINLNNENRDC